VNRFLFPITIALSYLSALFTKSAGKLFTARFARLHEFLRLLISRVDALKNMPVILIGYAPFNRLFCVRPTKTQKELTNVIIYGKTRIGKGLNLPPIFSGGRYCQRHQTRVLGRNGRLAAERIKRPLPHL
jgi:hypothetical protein